MNSPISHVVATCAALAGFTISILAGLAAGNEGITILGRALIAMIACWIVGLTCGLVIQSAVRRQVEREAEQEEQAADAHRADAAERRSDSTSSPERTAA